MSLDRMLELLRTPPEPLTRLKSVPELYLVGGTLRDAAWGHACRDLDLAAPAPLAPLLELIAAEFAAKPFELNQRFMSHRVVLEGHVLDISPLHPDGLAADLERRDYTINALAVPVARLGPELTADDLALHPRTLEDLAAHRLRMVSAANLEQDPLRILRGYRLAAQHALTVDPATRAAWRALAQHVTQSAGERLHEELARWLGAAAELEPAMRGCAADGVLWQLFPALQATAGCEQNGYHHLDVWEHTLLALSELDRLRRELPPALAPWAAELTAAWEQPVGNVATAGALTRLALLLHDLGKPPTRSVQPDGHATFYTHQHAGIELAGPELEALRFSREETGYIHKLIREHLRLGFYSAKLPLPPRLVFRFIRNLGPQTPLMLLHSLADCAAARGELSTGGWERHLAAAAQILAHYYAADLLAQPPVLLDGEAIMALVGIPPGKLVGRLKRALLEATALGEVATVEQAREFIRRRYASRPADGADGEH